jgi:hypothetical protein
LEISWLWLSKPMVWVSCVLLGIVWGNGHSYEAEGWIFLKPGYLINGGRIMKPLTIPGHMIDQADS